MSTSVALTFTFVITRTHLIGLLLINALEWRLCQRLFNAIIKYIVSTTNIRMIVEEQVSNVVYSGANETRLCCLLIKCRLCCLSFSFGHSFAASGLEFNQNAI